MNQRVFKIPVPQSDPPLSPRVTLPTMYDLPSENPEEPGLPDEFHALQPQLLSRTFRSPRYPNDRVFTGSDLNLYYDLHHLNWYKRPDWFVVVDVSRLYDGTDLRSSYVVWQETASPFAIVELLSPGTEKEDLGQAFQLETEMETPDDPEPSSGQTEEQPSPESLPHKWEVYEQILRVPYYFVFSRYTNRLRAFHLVGGQYEEQTLNPDNPRIWVRELGLGLGLWQGTFEGITRLWLRWYNADNWIPTDAELAEQQRDLAQEQIEQERQRAEQEHQRAEQEHQRAEQERQMREELLAKLRARGIDPDTL